MKEASFSVSELRTFLEEKWGGGRRFESFELVTEASRMENFRVKTAHGECFLAKCVPVTENPAPLFVTNFIPHLKELSGVSIVIHLVHEPIEWNGCIVAALSWCSGVRVMPHRITPVQRENLIRAYSEFSNAINKTSIVFPARDSIRERNVVTEKLSGFGCGVLRRFVEREIPESSLRYDETKLRVIHGDLHHGNFHFDGDVVSGIMDLEEFRKGYATDDWVRYLLVGAEHLHWFDFVGRRRIIEFFKTLAPLYPADEWRLSVNAFYVHKMFRRFSRNRSRMKAVYFAWKMFFRLRFYRELRKCIG